MASLEYAVPYFQKSWTIPKPPTSWLWLIFETVNRSSETSCRPVTLKNRAQVCGMFFVRYGSTLGSMSQTFLHCRPSSLLSRTLPGAGSPIFGLAPIAMLWSVRALIVCGCLNSTVMQESLSSTLSVSALIALSDAGSLTAMTYRSLPYGLTSIRSLPTW